jgi:Phytanoyl-CoA dioxygenase (PhyH)
MRTAEFEDLTEENRRSRDAGRERRLIALRHELALERLRDPAPARFSPPVPRRFDLDGSPPEVPRSALEPAVARYAIERHGALVVRDLVPTGDARSLVTVIDQVFTSFDAVTTQGAPKDAWFSPFPGRDASVNGTRAWLRTKGGVLTGDSPRATFEVAEVFRSQGIDVLAEQYLGQPPVLSLDKWTLRRGRAENGIEWHQDGSFLGDGVHSLNVWLALSDCGVEAPSLDIVPRRFDSIVPTGTDGASFSWSVGDDAARRAAAPLRWQRLSFRAGDALLFDDKMLHRTGGDPGMTQTRYAIETWFFAPAGDTSAVLVPLVL